MTPKGTLFLFPCPIVEGQIDTLPKETIDALRNTTSFLVERAKTARHFLKRAGHPIALPELAIQEITDETADVIAFLQRLLEGKNIGVLSEAGCPGIADPGSVAVQWAHTHNITVKPMVGPSSIVLAMMASGLNGQSFAFNGYLPNKVPELAREIKALEAKVTRTKQAQIFMETPYRNEFLIKNLLANLHPSTRLCIACDISAATETIRLLPVIDWKKEKTDVYQRRPCIFIIG